MKAGVGLVGPACTSVSPCHKGGGPGGGTDAYAVSARLTEGDDKGIPICMPTVTGTVGDASTPATVEVGDGALTLADESESGEDTRVDSGRLKWREPRRGRRGSSPVLLLLACTPVLRRGRVPAASVGWTGGYGEADVVSSRKNGARDDCSP